MKTSIQKLADEIQAVGDYNERAKTQLTILHDIALQREKDIHDLTADNHMLMELLLKYGGHENKCNYIEEMCSGRMLKEQEEELCDCGWSETMLMIKSRMSQ